MANSGGPTMGSVIKVGLSIVILLGAGAGGCLWGCPQYNVYSSEMSGKAQLAEAVSNRQTKTLEAKAEMESARYKAQAEIERAKGAAQANDIIMNKLGGPEGYLEYLKIEAIKESQNRIIYIPTEATLPITEAGKRPSK